MNPLAPSEAPALHQAPHLAHLGGIGKILTWGVAGVLVGYPIYQLVRDRVSGIRNDIRQVTGI